MFGLSRGLGETNRQRWDAEAERWTRLDQLRLIIDGRVFAAPTIREHAITSAGEAHWSIDPALVAACVVYEQTQVVHVPLRLLRGAKHRTTILMALRSLAWRSGTAPPAAVLEHDDNLLSVRLTEQQLRAEFGLEGVARDGLLRHHLDPSVAELDALDIGLSVHVAPRTAFRAVPAARRPRVMGYDVTVGWDNAELTPAEKTTRVGGIRHRRGDESRMRRLRPTPLFDHAAPASDNSDNVVEFKPLSGFRQLRALRPSDED